MQGRLSSSVMARICHEKTGLFPAPADITFSCSCPDWAGMCKHVAATLYGIGARLDGQPDLMFTLRQVKAQDLIAQAGTDLATKPKRRSTAKGLEGGNLSEIFGIDVQAEVPSSSVRATRARTPARKKTPRASAPEAAKKSTTKKLSTKKPVRKKKPVNKKAEAMRRYWEARRRVAGKSAG
jgi:uncharacterized Zn finger protein